MMKIIFSIGLILSPILSIYCQKLDVFDEMGKHVSDIYLIESNGEFQSDLIEQSIKNLSKLDFEKINRNHFYSSDTFNLDRISSQIHSWVDEEEQLLFQYIEAENSVMDSIWKIVGDVGVYSGWNINGKGNYYLRYDSTKNNILNLILRSNEKILSVYTQLPFSTIAMNQNRSLEQDQYLELKISQFEKIVRSMGDHLIPEHLQIFRKSDEPMTAEERVFGFNKFWNEVKYNFAFFDQVPDLDWEKVYFDFLPTIISEQSNKAYYDKLLKLCALLEDGHTNIYPPFGKDYPALAIKEVDGRALVSNVDKSIESKVPIGSEIIEVADQEIHTFLMSQVFPYISSSTDYIRIKRGTESALEGESDTEVNFTVRKPDGKISNVSLPRNANKRLVTWVKNWPRYPTTEFRELNGNTCYLALNGFGRNAVVEEFESLIDTLKNYDNYIIDLRNNGGGSSGYGYDILKHFANKPFATSKWSTREHLPSFKAWGQQYKESADSTLNEWQLKAKQVANGTYWYTSVPDTIQPLKTLDFEKFIVLIGNNTASAAEDFLIALDDLGFGTLIGEPTFGSTGQPLVINMPRGGSARICTKKDTYPDGREFVGYGIKPDILVEETLEAYIEDRDDALAKALELINGR